VTEIDRYRERRTLSEGKRLRETDRHSVRVCKENTHKQTDRKNDSQTDRMNDRQI
jgi:hypothetical protein